MSKQDSLASCLAKMYESKVERATGAGKSTSKTPAGVNSMTTMDTKLNLLNEKVDKLLHFQEDVLEKLERVHRGMDILEKGMDKLAACHGPTQQRDMEIGLKPGGSSVHGVCSEIMKLLKIVHEDCEEHREKLDGLEKVVSTMDTVMAFVGRTFRNSKIVDFILKGAVPWKKGSESETPEEAKDKTEEKETKPKNEISSRALPAEIRRSAGNAKKGSGLEENKEIEQNTNWCGNAHTKLESAVQAKDRLSPLETYKPFDKAHGSKTCVQEVPGERSRESGTHTAPDLQQNQTDSSQVTADRVKLEEHCRTEGTSGDPHSSALSTEFVSSAPQVTPESACEVRLPRVSTCAQEADIPDMTHISQESNTGDLPVTENGQSQDTAKHKPVFHRTDIPQNVKYQDKLAMKTGKVQTPGHKTTRSKKSQENSDKKFTSVTQLRTSDADWKEQAEDPRKGSKEGPQAVMHGVTEGAEHHKGELVKKESDPNQAPDQPHGSTLLPDPGTDFAAAVVDVIDDCPPPPAPFNHRIVCVKKVLPSSCYTVCQHEVLGGGRFGQVHKCIEMSSGLRLAAKIIKVKGAKDREEVKNEINVMNQLSHVNLIQLYDAFECKNDLTLIMEYVDGGELFDRITDENYNLTELDAIMFTKQICEGVYYLHQQYILHLDLKPENILCVNHTGNQIKLIDFGLARRYKPREKLKVNFGTPEFLAPEVVNYEFVSFPTDMWSVGVITYMLLSGLSPFLGESDAETMNYIVNCNWDFDSETFDQVSEEAKDFISKLLVKEKSCRLSAGQCLKHDWMVDLPLKAKKCKVRLKSQVLLQKYLAQRKWKKHFYVVAAANRLRKFQLLSNKPA
ncbi:myosin light chain kinase 3 isoform X1 [Ascaphus truei]|uniref:myosin light chain kinase 3 isoform X1 n=1 Tax=Ascaphus truei TaxID=8439 RepID=UPI003F59E4A1